MREMVEGRNMWLARKIQDARNFEREASVTCDWYCQLSESRIPGSP